MDLDNDGFISMDESARFNGTYKTNGNATFDSSMFKILDADGDGRISRAESYTSAGFGVFGLSCFTNNYGLCTKEACKSGGSCDDWTYANWGAKYEGTSSCRIPLNLGADWGGPNTAKCYNLQSKYSGTIANAWMDDACIVNNMNTLDCTREGGTPVSRAETEAQCKSYKGCFNRIYNTMTAVSESQCSTGMTVTANKLSYKAPSGDICASDQFQWRNVSEWTPGVWSSSKMTSVGIQWTKRKLESKNKWQKEVPLGKLVDLVYEAAFAMAAEVYVGEFKCKMEPLQGILNTVACTCGLDKTKNTAICTDIMKEIKPSLIATTTAFLSEEKKQTLVQPGIGSVSFTSEDLKRTVNKSRGGDYTTVELLYTDAMKLRTSGDRTVTSTKITCEQFKVIKNPKDEVIGQLAGNGLVVKGLKDANVSICVAAWEAIPSCSSLRKYYVPDFVLGVGKDARPGMPSVSIDKSDLFDSNTSVSIDKSNLFCGVVRLGPSAELGTTVYPVLRTDKMLLLTPDYYGEYVDSTIILSGDNVNHNLVTTIRNKNHFIDGLHMMAAFRKSIASALTYASMEVSKSGQSGSVLYPHDITILKVCDAEDKDLDDCIDLTQDTITRTVSNSRSGPIKVIYRMGPPKALFMSMDKMCAALMTMFRDGVEQGTALDTYSTSLVQTHVVKFENYFAEEGYIITAGGFVPPLACSPVVPADSLFSLVLIIKMPLSKAEFDVGKQEKFKEAMSATAGINTQNIDIVSITEGRRRAGSINVETRLRTADSASLQKLASQLGSGDALLAKINTELVKRGLPASGGATIQAKPGTTALLEPPKEELSRGGLAGSVIGAVIGAFVFLVCCCVGAYFACFKQKKSEKGTDAEPEMQLVEMHLLMDIDDPLLFEGTGQEVSLRRESFVNVMKQDLADATGMSTLDFNIVKVSQDPLVVDMTAPEAAAQAIYRQSLNPSSMLRSGQVTRRIVSVDLTVRQSFRPRSDVPMVMSAQAPATLVYAGPGRVAGSVRAPKHATGTLREQAVSQTRESYLPPGWEVFQDETTGLDYFYNPQTGVTTWDPPGQY
jgi:hypothetical protein